MGSQLSIVYYDQNYRRDAMNVPFTTLRPPAPAPMPPWNTLPKNIPQFVFPESRQLQGSLFSGRVDRRQWKISTNRTQGRPWNTPCFAAGLDAIRDWESRYGVTFVPESDMAVYYSGAEGFSE